LKFSYFIDLGQNIKIIKDLRKLLSVFSFFVFLYKSKTTMKNICSLLFILIILVSCNKEEDFIETLPSCSTEIVFTHFPINMEHVINFVPLGHYNPPGHVFPSDHHYFNIEHGFGNIDIYAPCDGWITFVSENQLPPPISKEYAFELMACKEIKKKSTRSCS
jgi:hypothetical protein